MIISTSRPSLAVAAAALTGVQVGLAIVATRFVIGQTDPATLAFLRYLIGFLCLLPLALWADRSRVEARDLFPIALLGVIQFGVLVALMNYGLEYLPAARAALIFALTPFLTLLFSAALGQERLTLPKTLGVGLCLLGVGLALGEKALESGLELDQGWRGELAVLGSALCGAACSVLYRPYLRKYPPLPLSALAMLASVGFLALLAAREGSFQHPPRLSPSGWGAVLFIGLGSGAGYFSWLWALRHASPTRVTVFLSLSPLTATLAGALLLAEPVGWPAWLGLGCVGLGLWLAHRPGASAPGKAKG